MPLGILENAALKARDEALANNCMRMGSDIHALEAENAELRERIKMLERDLTIARECIEMFMVCDPSDSFRVKAEDESDEYHTGTEAIERIDAALAGGKE